MNLDDFSKNIKEKYNLKEFRLYSNQYGDIVLDMIAANEKKQGNGSAAMTELINLADKYNKRILLTTALKDDKWGTTSKNRLINFYKRFGFVENKGRNKDFSTMHNMIRIPKKILKEKLSFKQFLLKESPLPDDWDKDQFTDKTSFKKQLKYALERAQKMGAGSSRVAFKINYQGRPTILKIAKNRKGLAQNAQEVNILNDGYLSKLDIMIPMIDYDDRSNNSRWIHVEFANKAKESDFIKECGVSLNDLVDYCEYKAKGTTGSRFIDRIKSKIDEESDLVQNLMTFIGSLDVPTGDYRRLSNWGVYNGKLVIIDVGLSQDILDNYYS